MKKSPEMAKNSLVFANLQDGRQEYKKSDELSGKAPFYPGFLECWSLNLSL